jgi:catechol 2,3-dioxygenase-like lactoylglutathione lyase family enzyme
VDGVGSVRFDQLNLVSGDVQASRAFYARFGVAFQDEGDPLWDQHHVSGQHSDEVPVDIDIDSTTFAPKWNTGWSGGTGVVLGFKVETRDEVDAMVTALAADGVPVQQPPFDAFWGARYAVVSDPDGNAVGIMSPVDAERRGPPPDPR